MDVELSQFHGSRFGSFGDGIIKLACLRLDAQYTRANRALINVLSGSRNINFGKWKN